MSPLLRRLRLAIALATSFGLRWILFRVQYFVLHRTGMMRRRFRARSWDDAPLADLLKDPSEASADRYYSVRRGAASRFLFDPADRARVGALLQQLGSRDVILHEADSLLDGRWSWFGGPPVQVGTPPDWHRNPFTGQRAPSDIHWSALGDFAFGDIKVIWEPSRFSCVYALVRASWATGDDKYAELFWTLVESWRRENPPGFGANWKCGQETSFRIMAWCFGLYGFIDSSATTPERVVQLAQMIALSAERVEANIDYALSQENNHGISEGLGLFTVGLLFPELKDAARWRTNGRRVLESLGRSLIYDDGAFSQHSLNYHRVMLHDYCWVIRLADVCEEPLSVELRARVLAAVRFLYALQDADTGRVPQYGAFDGSLILPLANGSRDDFRSVVQAGFALLAGHRVFESGPWDEEMLWLLGPLALALPLEPPRRTALEAHVGGYYTLRGTNGFAFMRCASFRHRPGHADQLHVDLWWKGINIASDPGTYGYNATATWARQFDETSVHNTVVVDGLDQMDRVSRFLWYPWSTGRVRPSRQSGTEGYWEGEHDGYTRLSPSVSHRRAVLRLSDDAWLVLDAMDSGSERVFQQHWLLPDVPHQFNADRGIVTIETDEGEYGLRAGVLGAPATTSLVRADPDSARGWRAERYGARVPALSLETATRTSSAVMWTVFSAVPCDVAMTRNGVEIETASWRATAQIDARSAGPLARVSRIVRDAAGAPSIANGSAG